MGLDPITIVASLVALLIALTLHEFAHALMGHYLGDSTARDQGRLTLNPLSHIDPFMTLALPLVLILLGAPVLAAAKPVPFNPWAVRGGRWGAALVALAGPFTNLFLAIFFGLWLRFMPVNELSGQFLGALVTVNIALFVFNMIPFPPLDGSRLLYAVAPSGLRQAMDKLEQAGLMIIFLVILLGYQFIAPVLFEVTRFLTNLIVPTPFP